MRINYKGISAEYKYRVAEINYDDESEKEILLMDKIQNLLEKQGYILDIAVSGYAVVEVEDREEYNIFKKDYMKAKKKVLSEIKNRFWYYIN